MELLGTKPRVIVVGIGAVGGTLAAALSLAGHEVVGVARGKQLDAIRHHGLRLKTSTSDRVAEFECVGSFGDIELRPNDLILIGVKSQDTPEVFEQLRHAGAYQHAIFCTQNGIANEREGQRYFPNVHGMTVMMPSMYLTPGEVAVFGAPRFGILDVGRAQAGVDDADKALVALLASANFAAFTSTDIMASKRAKLLLNLGNVVQAALGLGADTGDIVSRLYAEAQDVYRARGLTWLDISKPDPRLEKFMQVVPVDGAQRVGGSTVQSLLRDTGSIETDYLNGEIVLQARLAGVEAPLNAAMARLGRRLLQDRAKPGSMTLAQLEAHLE
ncbi:MAG: ketopantoate reductase family protein [Gammaproteobacteria bacterium]